MGRKHGRPYEWLACEADETEQTIFAADSAKGLANILGLRENTIAAAGCRAGRVKWEQGWVKIRRVTVEMTEQ